MVFQKLTSQVALAFLTDYPTPQSATLLGEGRMRQFCRRHSYRGGKSPVELVARLRKVPAGMNPIAPTVLAAIVGGSVAQIRILNAQIVALRASSPGPWPCTQRQLCCKLFRVANVSLAALIAEIGPLLERCDNPEQVAALCGAAPVTRASGKSRVVTFRYTANKPARVAIAGFADNSRHSPASAANSYRRAQARGARHPHAVRKLARGWVRVLWACWTTTPSMTHPGTAANSSSPPPLDPDSSSPPNSRCSTSYAAAAGALPLLATQGRSARPLPTPRPHRRRHPPGLVAGLGLPQSHPGLRDPVQDRPGQPQPDPRRRRTRPEQLQARRPQHQDQARVDVGSHQWGLGGQVGQEP